MGERGGREEAVWRVGWGGVEEKTAKRSAETRATEYGNFILHNNPSHATQHVRYTAGGRE
jgi:hypothetical protein